MSPADTDRERPLVLIADDEPTSRLLTCEALEHAGFRVATGEDGAAAAREFARARPDLVLLDVDMPVLDGYAACAAMRALPGDAHVPIVMLTAREDLESINRAYAAGATDFIAKPINWALLGHRARYFLRSGLAARRMERLGRISAVLSGINSAIVRFREPGELMDESCRIAVQHGGFAFAWIGMADARTGAVLPVARAGEDGGYLDVARFNVREDSPDGATLVGQAMRAGKPFVRNDIAGDDRLPNGARALARGFRAVVVLPLVVESQCAGAMVLYSSNPGVFDDEEMRLLQELANDVSFGLEHIGKERRLHHLAYYDALTGLPNRTLFQERLVALTEASRPGSRKVVTAIVDIRGFRVVNDNLGRHGGDALLKLIAQRLRDTLRASDTLGRIGGDQFGLILTDIAADGQIAPLLDKILGALSAPFELEGKVTRVLAKAGVTVFPNDTDGTTAEALLANAESAAKRAKAVPEPYVFHAPHINAAISERIAMEGRLLRAVEEGQFALHYQPKLDLRSGAITGLEALLRWNDPERGQMLPSRFVPLLEETGMIVEVGRWLLGRAAADLAALRGRGFGKLRISVNVSPVQLRQRDFAARVAQALGDPREAGIDLEITESMMIADPARGIEVLRGLRDLGIGVALDDFGTGYSSLSYLARMPASTLKIDKSFIDDLVASPEKLAIVSTVISLAHALDMRTVAEGVETEEQSRLLRLLKCDEIQGYLVARPQPLEQVEELLRASASSLAPA